MRLGSVLVCLAGCRFSGGIEVPPIDAPGVVVDAAARPACATDPAYIQGSVTLVRYRPVTNARTWVAARADCAVAGGHLVVIGDPAENAYVDDLLPDEIWIGLSDATLEGTFVWITHAPVTYTHWRSGEPNDGDGQEPQDCAQIDDAGDGRWNDDNCADLEAYVCECPT